MAIGKFGGSGLLLSANYDQPITIVVPPSDRETILSITRVYRSDSNFGASTCRLLFQCPPNVGIWRTGVFEGRIAAKQPLSGPSLPGEREALKKARGS